MYAEFIGLSGSGKSTLRLAARTAVRDRGIPYRSLFRFCGDADLSDSENWKTHRSKAAKRERAVMMALWSYCARLPELSANLLAAAAHTPRQRSDICVLMADLEILTQLKHDRMLISVDEGILHRGLTAHHAAGDKQAFEQFLTVLPKPDLVVHVDVSPEETLERSQTRRRGSVGAGGKRATVEELNGIAEMLGRLSGALDAAGVPVLRIPASAGVEDGAEIIAERVEAMIGPEYLTKSGTRPLAMGDASL